jgi:hypothetical protein
LRAAAKDDNFLAFQFVHAAGEFGFVHETALAELFQLQA